MKHILSRADAFLFALIVAIAVAGIVLMSSGHTAQTAQIRKDGQIVRQIDLSTGQSFWVETVHFEVKDGAVRFAQSDCPGQECVHVGWMKRPGSSMACLPNRISLTVLGQSEVDAVAE